MALHHDFPESPHAILNPKVRWFPADEALRETNMDKLMPPLVPRLRRKVQEWRDADYVGATATSKSLLTWWFKTPHLLEQADGNMAEFQYFFAQREAIETIVYLVDVVGAKDKHDLMRFDGSGSVSDASAAPAVRNAASADGHVAAESRDHGAKIPLPPANLTCTPAPA